MYVDEFATNSPYLYFVHRWVARRADFMAGGYRDTTCSHVPWTVTTRTEAWIHGPVSDGGTACPGQEQFHLSMPSMDNCAACMRNADRSCVTCQLAWLTVPVLSQFCVTHSILWSEVVLFSVTLVMCIPFLILKVRYPAIKNTFMVSFITGWL